MHDYATVWEMSGLWYIAYRDQACTYGIADEKVFSTRAAAEKTASQKASNVEVRGASR